MGLDKMKITESNLQKLIEIALNTPETIKDYCYYDGMPTDWHRGILNHRKNGEYIDYWCEECCTKRHYNLSKLKKMKQEMEE